MSSPYLTLAEAAEYLRVSLSTFKKEVRPVVPCCRVGRKPVFRAADLDAYMTEHTYFTTQRARRGKGSGESAFASNTNATKLFKELG